MADLTTKQKLFIEEYLEDFNKTRAYMRAFNNPNYNSSSVSASRLCENPNIQAAINKRIEEDKKKISLMTWKLIDDTYKKAFGDITQIAKVMGDNVTIEDFNNLTREQKRLIKGAKMGKNGVEVEFVDQLKEKALLNQLLKEREQKENGFNVYDLSMLGGLNIEQLILLANQDVNLDGEEEDDE